LSGPGGPTPESRITADIADVAIAPRRAEYVIDAPVVSPKPTRADLVASQQEARAKTRRGWFIGGRVEVKQGQVAEFTSSRGDGLTGRTYTKDEFGTLRRAGMSKKTKGKAARKAEKRARHITNKVIRPQES
jgi:hypothetical protein